MLFVEIAHSHLKNTSATYGALKLCPSEKVKRINTRERLQLNFGEPKTRS